MNPTNLLAALCTAATLALAAPAAATIVQADITAEFFTFSGPAGFFPQAPPCMDPLCETTTTSGGREFVNFPIGGSPWNATFTFDTSRGALTLVPGGGEVLQWTSGNGPSPLLSGTLTWQAVGLQRDLSDATAFSIQRIGDALGYTISGPGYNFASFLGIGPSGPAALSDPYFRLCNCSGVSYSDATFDAPGGETFTQRLTPQPIPEPSTWAMLILGFFGLGAVLRRARPLPGGYARTAG